MSFPELNVRELKHLNYKKSFNCFYGIDNKNNKLEAMELIFKQMSNYRNFNICYDFRMFTKTNKKEWSFVGNIMIYENHDVTNENRILKGGSGNYECVLWMSANS